MIGLSIPILYRKLLNMLLEVGYCALERGLEGLSVVEFAPCLSESGRRGTGGLDFPKEAGLAGKQLRAKGRHGGNSKHLAGLELRSTSMIWPSKSICAGLAAGSDWLAPLT